jgi:hypothetical protein
VADSVMDADHPARHSKLKELRFKVRHRLFVFKRQWLCHPFFHWFYPRPGFPRRLIACLLAFLILVPTLFLLFHPKEIKAAWFDQSYGYRQKISFTHNADISSERRVTFSLDTAELISAGIMQTDCDDTRFTDINGKLLRFQLTGTCNNSATTYQIVFPTVINGTNVGYVYYSNASARSASQNVSSVTALTPSGGNPSITDRSLEEKSPAPVLWYKFDEGYGTTVNSTGSCATCSATLTNMASPPATNSGWTNSGKFGKALNFDGENDYVGISNGIPGNNFTIAGWVNLFSTPTSPTTYQTMYSDASGSKGMFLKDYKINWFYGSNILTGNTALSPNKWYHTTITYDGNTLVAYVNGVSDGNASSNTQSLPTGALRIGDSLGNDHFAGKIDDLRVYNYALTADEVKAVYNQNSAALLSKDPNASLSDGLVGYWKMDDGVGNACPAGVDKACDSSGNNNTGTWSGQTASTSGKFGFATTYDGTNDNINIPDNDAFSVTTTNQLTVSTWIYTSTFNNGLPISKGAGGNNYEWDIRVVSGGGQINVSLYNPDGAAAYLTVQSSENLTSNTWTHVLFTADLTKPSLKLYLNGILVGEDTTPSGTPYANGTAALRFGERADGNNDYTGKLDDVRIYNRSLSSSEVSESIPLI